MNSPQRRSRMPRMTRDGILFLGGFAGFIHEVTIWSGQERPFIIGACLGMMGLPAFLGWDEKKPPAKETLE